MDSRNNFKKHQEFCHKQADDSCSPEYKNTYYSLLKDMKITSKDNEKIKLLKKLSQKKHRKQTGLFKVENLVIINDAIKSGFLPQQLFITPALKSKVKNLNKIDQVFEINDKINKTFSDLDTPPGICAVFALPEEIIENDNLVYLNGVSDPGNLGTILRTGLAFGLTNFIYDDKSADPYNYKCLQAAKNAIFEVNLLKGDVDTLKQLKADKYEIIATDLKARKDIEELKLKSKYCLILGSESHGVSDDILKITTQKIKIKMTDDIESLNVAVAAGIIFYKQFK